MDNLRIVCNISPWTRNVFDLWPKQVSYSVEDSESPVTSMGDESGSTTSWTEVVGKRKKKPDGLKRKVIFSTGSSLVGKQSDPKLTLFTKRS
jgi:hypothetical protein